MSLTHAKKRGIRSRRERRKRKRMRRMRKRRSGRWEEEGQSKRRRRKRNELEGVEDWRSRERKIILPLAAWIEWLMEGKPRRGRPAWEEGDPELIRKDLSMKSNPRTQWVTDPLMVIYGREKRFRDYSLRFPDSRGQNGNPNIQGEEKCLTINWLLVPFQKWTVCLFVL